jgi:Flp pilus assembly protein TadD
MLTPKQQKFIRHNRHKHTIDDLAKTLRTTPEVIGEYIFSITKSDNITLPKYLTPNPAVSLGNIIRSSGWIFLLLMVLTFGVYANSLQGDFVMDDITYLVKNDHIASFSFVLETPFTIMKALINWLTYKGAGLNPPAFHLVNIIFHAGVAILVYLIAALFFKKRVAIMAAALTAVHPVFTESVSWIGGGGYVMYSFFYLLSLLLYVLSKDNKRLYTASVIFYLITLATSEKAIPLSLVYVIYELSRGRLKTNFRRLIPYLTLTGIWLFLIFGTSQYYQTRVSALQKMNYNAVGIYNPLAQIPVAISIYLELIFWPIKLAFFHSQQQFELTEFITRVGVFAIYGGILVWGFFHNRRLLFWPGILFICLIPSFSPIIISWLVAERYAYLGTIGIIVTVIYLMDIFITRYNLQKFFPTIVAIVAILLSARTVIRNLDWQNTGTLAKASLKNAPNDARMHNNMAVAYINNKDYDNAFRELETSIKIDPRYAGAYYNLGLVAAAQKNPDQELKFMLQSIQLDNTFAQSYEYLASKYYDEGKYPEAKLLVEKAIRSGLNTSFYRMNLGMINHKLGHRAEAIINLKEALKLDPKNATAQYWLDQFTKE